MSKTTPPELTPSTLVSFLKKLTVDASFTDRLKIAYRPYICPFHDLLNGIGLGRSIFDFGCGSGQFCLLLAEYSQPTKLRGIEISESLIDNAKTMLAPYTDRVEVDFDVYDGETLPEEIAEYEFVTMIDVFHHLPIPLHAWFFKELYDKMSPGRTLLVKDINGAHPFVLFNKLHDLIFGGEIGHEISPVAMRTLLKEAGFGDFRESKKTMFWYPHYTISCKK